MADNRPASEQWTCDWLEGGLAFNRSSLHACLIVHHGRGYPFLGNYRGGGIPLDSILAERAKVLELNQNGGHPACQGCPHLVKRTPKPAEYPITIVGIAHFAHCNIKCNYCYLQTQDPGSFAEGLRPYPLLPAIRSLIEERQLSPDAIIDWGGGEPTIYKEFDELLALLTNYGATHYIHTNGTSLPRPIREGLPGGKIHILCSLDAGTAETYERIKQSKAFHRVWENLAEYIRLGCHVTAKYIMMEDNSSEYELNAFLALMLTAGIRSLAIDIDYNHPDPQDSIVLALARLKYLSVTNGIHTTFGFTGANFRPEYNVSARVDAVYHQMCFSDLKGFMESRDFRTGEDAVFLAKKYIEQLEASIVLHRAVNATPLFKRALEILKRVFKNGKRSSFAKIAPDGE